MEDARIIDLYWARSEQAITETSSKYGRYCYKIAAHILADAEDAEESVNDTYLHAWNSMPPHRPSVLSTFLGKITRQLSIDKWKYRSADKRGGGEIPLALEELGGCVSSGGTVEETVQLRELTETINAFLKCLPETERDVFVSRYWFLASIREIAAAFHMSESKAKMMLFRTRNKLSAHLRKEGY